MGRVAMARIKVVFKVWAWFGKSSFTSTIQITADSLFKPHLSHFLTAESCKE